MKLIDYKLQCKSRSDKFYLIPIGDIHYGTKNCDVKKLDEIIQWIAITPNARWVGMGDAAEFINMSDTRFDPQNLAPELQGHLDNLVHHQIMQISRKLNVIRHKCIGLLEGNHEYSVKNKYHINPTDILADRLETVNLSYNCIVRINFDYKGGTPTRHVLVYASHGFGGGRKTGSKVNNLVDISQSFEADIYLVGHVHDKVGIDRERLEVATKGELKLFARKKVFALTGSFYKTYQKDSSSYGERAGYSPNPTGVVKITIEPFRHTTHSGPNPAHIHISE